MTEYMNCEDDKWTWQCSLCQQQFTARLESEGEYEDYIDLPDVAIEDYLLCENCANLLPDRNEIEPGDVEHLISSQDSTGHCVRVMQVDVSNNPGAWELVSSAPDPMPARPLFAFGYSEEPGPDGRSRLFVTQPGPLWHTLPLSKDVADVLSVYISWCQRHMDTRVVFFSDLTLWLAGGRGGQAHWGTRGTDWETALDEVLSFYNNDQIAGVLMSLDETSYTIACVPAKQHVFYYSGTVLSVKRSEHIQKLRDMVFNEWVKLLASS
jgi:hypothetical protein